nr:uncharacterized protein LOC131129259 isoform X5 [Doryrhamphus excisus]XP_057928587.1 uncharacterized protein LOC131129259 isoform X5 [Doryrhamphus excisus]XP_057928588.1 uncharacterized protein LOC131129259 isoform X5 [Doryrhamphus excisus]XP_057928589.1 uncharacterized protein LOC131129259 isoform X5 [Doryrhamphus excisus]XP_057928590.1 uncharacterized protein LOC131129259 isoform X5 [Doryrhamphus excisus]XP_057928591.1 uncharacterized protein LOC131129259 isoform X5 [Doryrhamphus excisus]
MLKEEINQLLCWRDDQLFPLFCVFQQGMLKEEINKLLCWRDDQLFPLFCVCQQSMLKEEINQLLCWRDDQLFPLFRVFQSMLKEEINQLLCWRRRPTVPALLCVSAWELAGRPQTSHQEGGWSVLQCNDDGVETRTSQLITPPTRPSTADACQNTANTRRPTSTSQSSSRLNIAAERTRSRSRDTPLFLGSCVRSPSPSHRTGFPLTHGQTEESPPRCVPAACLPSNARPEPRERRLLKSHFLTSLIHVVAKSWTQKRDSGDRGGLFQIQKCRVIPKALLGNTALWLYRVMNHTRAFIPIQ